MPSEVGIVDLQQIVNGLADGLRLRQTSRQGTEDLFVAPFVERSRLPRRLVDVQSRVDVIYELFEAGQLRAADPGTTKKNHLAFEHVVDEGVGEAGSVLGEFDWQRRPQFSPRFEDDPDTSFTTTDVSFALS